ncbi:hypothetical protein ACN9JG_07140 [Cereibacter azotoformans]|uniref:hypothetical protein n=1 Tax=Cereibacter azotoformans TaxID=43057 RepID=UPI003B20C26F
MSWAQSVFSAGGADAIELNRLFAVMLVGAVILWISLNGLFFHGTRRRTGHMSRKLAEAVIIGGGILPMERAALVSWIANAGAIKPEAQMPAFAHLSKTELDRLAGWLEALE